MDKKMKQKMETRFRVQGYLGFAGNGGLEKKMEITLNPKPCWGV